MKRRAAALVFGSFLGSALLFASPAALRFQRELIPARPGPNVARVDAGLLAGARPVRYRRAGSAAGAAGLEWAGGLEDLRLFDRGGREIPYLLLAPPSPAEVWVAGRLLPIVATKSESGFVADFALPRRVDRVRFDGLPAPFLKRFRLEGSGDGAHWSVLVAEGTLFDLPDEKLTALAVSFPPEDLRYFRVTWDDRMSARLRLPREVRARVVTARDPTPPLAVSVRVERRSSEPGRSRFRLTLPAARLPAVSLVLDAGAGNLLREARVVEPRLSGGEVAPHPLGGAVLRQAAKGDLVASNLTIPIDPPEGPELDLVVEDGDNPPFPLAAVRAELGPLPSLYFEAPSSDPLVARWGDPALSAPRYDLEAKRDAVAKSAPPEARWAPVPSPAMVTAESPASTPLPESGAPLEKGELAWCRVLTGIEPGLNAAFLDAAVLAHGPLTSLRIANDKGRQVPYLLESREEPLTLDLPTPSPVKSDRPHVSVYRVPLPFASLPASRLVLTTTARVFERGVRVSLARPDRERSEDGDLTLAQAMWRHATPETAPPALVLTLPALSSGTLTLSVDEGDNSPLPLLPPKLLLPSFRLRFFASGAGPLTLCYGGDLGAPRYDLALLAPRLVGAAAHEAALGPEAANASAGKGLNAGRIFWGVLVVAVLALLALLARLLNRGGGAGGAGEETPRPPAAA